LALGPQVLAERGQAASPAIAPGHSQVDAAEMHRFLSNLAAGVQRSLTESKTRQPGASEER
jgi:hypothetical protein